jgi:hypothetical protein
MEFFVARKLKFKAWNTETKLLMRLNAIECVKGELTKKQHILLQFTGLFDMQHEEIYDMDVLLKDSERYVIHWREEVNGWVISLLPGKYQSDFSVLDFVRNATRLCNYFEMNK